MSHGNTGRFAAFSKDEREILAMGLVAVASIAMEPDMLETRSDRHNAAKFLADVVPMLHEIVPDVSIPDDLMDKLNLVANRPDG